MQPSEQLLGYKTTKVKQARQVMEGGKLIIKSVEVDEDVPDPGSNQPNPEYQLWKPPPSVVYVKATLVVAPASLIGQWADELGKFAPSLTVAHYALKNKQDVLQRIDTIDVVLMTPATSFTDSRFKAVQFRRIILDECASNDYKSSNGRKWLDHRSDYLWGVTGTPLTSSVRDLEVMAELLGHWSAGVQLTRFAPPSSKSAAATSPGYHLDGLGPVLRTVMIRHTTNQQIHGEVALALPASQCEAIWLEMGHEDRQQYDLMGKWSGPSGPWEMHGRKAAMLEMDRGLNERRALIGPRADQPKLVELVRDLKALREIEPEMHAVVFTHSPVGVDVIMGTLAREGFTVSGFTGRTPTRERWQVIRDFQASIDALAPGIAKVFVATMRVGHIGITLTAASRVYLMEPCLDPSMEVQAAGRIRRLGQTRNVLVKRLVYKRSLDAAVLKLHAQIEAGRVAIANNIFPPKAIQILCSNGE